MNDQKPYDWATEDGEAVQADWDRFAHVPDPVRTPRKKPWFPVGRHDVGFT